jgi:hypothetical protein
VGNALDVYSQEDFSAYEGIMQVQVNNGYRSLEQKRIFSTNQIRQKKINGFVMERTTGKGLQYS